MADAPTAADFDALADIYDALIDWPARLRNEESFFRRLFDDCVVRRVLDTACGTGRHAAMFHSWGLTVEGADISPAMIARCRDHFGEPEGLRWVVRSFEQPGDSPGRFDAMVCIGNSLSLAADQSAVRRAIASMIETLQPGGVAVVQVLNLWAVPEGPTRWQTVTRIDDQRVILKGLHRAGGRGFIDLIELRPGVREPRFDSPRFMGIEAETLSATVRSCGGRNLRLYGDYQEAPYDRERSRDLLCVFRS